MDKCIRNKQRKILDFLLQNNIETEEIDLTINTSARDVMLEKIPKEKHSEKILPPQIFNQDQYCGDYEDFFNATEAGLQYTFLKLTPPSGSLEEKLLQKYARDGVVVNI